MKICILATTFPCFPGNEIHDGVHVHRFHYWLPHHWERLCYGGGIPENFRRNHLLIFQLPMLILGFVLRNLPFATDSDIMSGTLDFRGSCRLYHC